VSLGREAIRIAERVLGSPFDDVSWVWTRRREEGGVPQLRLARRCSRAVHDRTSTGIRCRILIRIIGFTAIAGCPARTYGLEVHAPTRVVRWSSRQVG
jgi:hypothetical protein